MKEGKRNETEKGDRKGGRRSENEALFLVAL